jgi:hypothetical protein
MDLLLSKAEQWLRIASVNLDNFELEQLDLYNSAEVIARKEFKKELTKYMKFINAQEKLEDEIAELLEAKNARG